MTSSPTQPHGMVMVLGCYLLWGFFPLYFHLLSAAGSVEIIGHRIVWTLVTCLLLGMVLHGWPRLRATVRRPRLLVALGAAGLLVSVNWLIYVYGVNTGRTADAALGYFINPLVTVALAAVFLGERLRRAQVVAIVLAGAAVALLAVVLGAVPLLLFAAGTARVPLSVVGLSQYIAPILQFLLAWAVFHEEISPARWAAMVLVWIAVAVFATDLVRQVTRRPRVRA